jgi:pSer/pThr/pTyr-binding forkhead associated (FHA) protein
VPRPRRNGERSVLEGRFEFMNERENRRNDTTLTQEDHRKIKSTGILIHKGLLLVLSDNYLGTTFVIDKVDTVMGRGKECEFCIGDPLVSKKHCRITVDEEGNFFIEDLGSKNQTYINKRMLKKKRQLFYGDRIVVGDTIMRFFLEEKLEKK